MTYKEIIEQLKELNIKVEDFAYNDMENPLKGIGTWDEVEQKGGEGQGEEWYSVKYFPAHNVYIRVDGFYTSYDGTDFDNGWDDVSEVKPIEKTIIDYVSC